MGPNVDVSTVSLQLKAKRSECNSKASHARNDYLLTLAAANAHQQRYYENDLMDCIKASVCVGAPAVVCVCVCVCVCSVCVCVS